MVISYCYYVIVAIIFILLFIICCILLLLKSYLLVTLKDKKGQQREAIDLIFEILIMISNV